MSAHMPDGELGRNFKEAAFIARSFLRQSRQWLIDRFGELKYDPCQDEELDTYLMLPAVSFQNSGEYSFSKIVRSLPIIHLES